MQDLGSSRYLFGTSEACEADAAVGAVRMKGFVLNAGVAFQFQAELHSTASVHRRSR
jgi:hypothetical protein